MRYFNGFSLHGEEQFFSDYLIQSDLCVAGFSYGAQQAFEYVYNTTQRVDRIILLSPAFFQNQKPSFTRTQLRYFQSGQEAYIKQFLANATYPSKVDLSAYLNTGTSEELEALLSYRWDSEKIKEVLKRGTTIEVFFGSEDKIIDANAAFEFFSDKTVTYLIKGAGHLLRK
ncbi:pimelyl-ACP methyl ester esterase BioV [Sulfurovum sp. zt1-1]|uniref:Pimelyl-ACP methyl ester esterase BioV n=1 Tax=Sulfurovum zhangzhouensis TaxID=3019067 RepID=A0ABT7QYL3_9BACT|nr:pimelyl-ACP methyl ester esterase BioV [Sulfurovum zhangzhouensis]MDM5271932.1 pimelyl-ACP methyl ester esterase BioV [Sulfurovum zhangzhouensis]